mmetsp:Transcript_39865/g.72609  ORF Transcript_39865/g.72609 Transcript_39865/m.72609 type:complete len:763 (-) Transcript_39865:54-2342(-)
MSPEPKVQVGGDERRGTLAAQAGKETRFSTWAAPAAAPPRDSTAAHGGPGAVRSWRSNTAARSSGIYSEKDVEEASKQAEIIREFLEAREGSSLKAWLFYFDTNGDQKISLNEFIRGMRRLNYSGDVTHAFTLLDKDGSGELSLEEIDVAQASLWRSFCKWSMNEFDSTQDMIDRLGSKEDGGDKVSEKTFINNLEKLGWNGGFASLIFQSLDVDSVGYVTTGCLKWLETEKRRQKRKETARMKAAMQEKRSKAIQRRIAEEQMNEFKVFLRRKYGSFIRAWRCALSEHSLNLTRAELFKAIAAIGFPCDVRSLWQAFDKDDSGTISIEELHPKGAEILAHFHKFVQDNFGSACAAFRAFDKTHKKKLRLPEFLAAVKGHGFHLPAKNLFHGLDTHGHKVIIEDDFIFLDNWKPPAFLVADANYGSADEVKRLLLRTYKNFLKAWRHCLDVDSSNRCSWKEFEAACKKIGFIGDIPGAWRALDDDLSGFITLHEIDSDAAETLFAFKRWAEEEFGSVRTAFGVFDTDGSNEVSYREFRRACRAYGLNADVHTLFHALDVEKSGTLSVDEVSFLDDWEDQDVAPAGQQAEAESDTIEIESVKWQGAREAELTAYETPGPGPAYYALPQGFGARDHVPMNRFSGAYTFRKRTPRVDRLPWLCNMDSAHTPAPVKYNDERGMRLTAPCKPTWSFGGEVRAAVERSKIDERRGPGPGQYTTTSFDIRRPDGPAVMCLPRRPLRAHPLFQHKPCPRAPPRVSYTVKR